MTKESFHQQLMTAAYDRYEQSWAKAQFEAQLTCAERRAVLVGNMNYQVENGGFGQWLGNGYATAANVTLIRAYLGEMDCQEAGWVDALLAQFQQLCDSRGWNPNHWDDRDGDALDALDLDKQYYHVNSAFMAKFNEYLIGLYGPKPITEETTARLAAELRAMQKMEQDQRAADASHSLALAVAIEHVLGSPSSLVRFAYLLRMHATRDSALRELCGGEL